MLSLNITNNTTNNRDPSQVVFKSLEREISFKWRVGGVYGPTTFASKDGKRVYLWSHNKCVWVNKSISSSMVVIKKLKKLLAYFPISQQRPDFLRDPGIWPCLVVFSCILSIYYGWDFLVRSVCYIVVLFMLSVGVAWFNNATSLIFVVLLLLINLCNVSR